MTTNESSQPAVQSAADSVGESVWNEILKLFPMQRSAERLGMLAGLWMRELQIHWIVLEGAGLRGGFLKSSIEERRLEPGRILQEGTPSPAINQQEWDGATVWEFLAEDGSQRLGIVRLDRNAAERPEGGRLRSWTEWLFRKSDEWDRELLAAKLEALAEFSAGAGHEINNPLGTITGRVQLLLMKESDPGRRQMLEIIGGQALRVRDMIGDVMLFARPPEPKFERIDLGTWLPTILARYQTQAEKQGTKFDLEIAEGITLWGDTTQAGVAIGALLHNSLNALGEGGEIRLTVQVVSGADSTKPFARIIVEDNGPGLSPVERVHLFDPFFSGRQAGRGLGFGLPKAWRIVTQHGGTIQAVERAPRGLQMIIDWPTAVGENEEIEREPGTGRDVV